MGIRKTPRFLVGVSALAMLGGLAACSGEGGEGGEAASPQTPAGYGSAGEGGEGGEAGAETGAGGEFGIDPVAAANDPVVFLTALEVMRAHYVAGIDALRAGERMAGAEMFAHPISEIYVDLEPVLEARGVPSFMDTLTAASVAPYQGASDDEINARVDAVYAALDLAEAAAPESGDLVNTQTRVLADLIERAALQYEFAAGTATGDAYLDGYGYAVTARQWAERSRAGRVARDAGLAAQIDATLTVLDAAYPGAVRPESFAVPVADVLAANAALQSQLSAG